MIRACDYEVLGHFTLPESAWWEPYYQPLEERLRLRAGGMLRSRRSW